MASMLVATITNMPDDFSAFAQRAEAQVDVIEFQFDYFPSVDLTAVKALMSVLSVPVIFTVRRADQGGEYRGSERERLDLIGALLALSPNYFDIEAQTDPVFIQAIHQAFPFTQLIGSAHFFERASFSLEVMFESMLNEAFSIYKLVTYANSILDVIEMFQFLVKYGNRYPLCGLCMGREGLLTRLLSPIFGNVFHYGFFPGEKVTAPGQIRVDHLRKIYQRDAISSKFIHAFLDEDNVIAG